MNAKPRTLAVVACCAALAVSGPAGAQPGDSGNIKLDAPAVLVRKPRPGPPEVRALPQAWPRLDAGSVLCRSEDDLNRLGRRRAGETVEGTVDCQLIRVPTAIAIVQRKGPGRTEVRPADAQPMESGWTDAWLPQKAPTGAASASR